MKTNLVWLEERDYGQYLKEAEMKEVPNGLRLDKELLY